MDTSVPFHQSSVYDFEITPPELHKTLLEPSTPVQQQNISVVSQSPLTNEEVSNMQRELTECKQLIEQQRNEIEFLKSKLSAKKQGPPKFDRALPVEVRRIYGEYVLKNECYDFSHRFDFIENKAMTRKIIDSIQFLHRRSYTPAEITMCCKTYFKSLKDDIQRDLNGIKDKHRKAAARRERLNSKLNRRKRCLNFGVKPPLSSDQLHKANDMLLNGGLAYMSSDESEDECDEKNTRLVRRLSFESPEMTQIKRVIDEHYLQVADKRGLSKLKRLVKSGRSPLSSRTVPKKVLNWAVDIFLPNSPDSAVQYTNL